MDDSCGKQMTDTENSWKNDAQDLERGGEEGIPEECVQRLDSGAGEEHGLSVVDISRDVDEPCEGLQGGPTEEEGRGTDSQQDVENIITPMLKTEKGEVEEKTEMHTTDEVKEVKSQNSAESLSMQQNENTSGLDSSLAGLPADIPLSTTTDEYSTENTHLDREQSKEVPQTTDSSNAELVITDIRDSKAQSDCTVQRSDSSIVTSDGVVEESNYHQTGEVDTGTSSVSVAENICHPINEGDKGKGTVVEAEQFNEALQERSLSEVSGNINDTDQMGGAAEVEHENYDSYGNLSTEELFEDGIKLIDVRSLSEGESSGNTSREISVEREWEKDRSTCQEISMEGELESGARGIQEDSMQGFGKGSEAENEEIAGSKVITYNGPGEGSQVEVMETRETTNEDEAKVVDSVESPVHENTECEVQGHDKTVEQRCASVEDQRIKDLGRNTHYAEESMETEHLEGVHTSTTSALDDSVDDEDSDGRLMIDTETENEETDTIQMENNENDPHSGSSTVTDNIRTSETETVVAAENQISLGQQEPHSNDTDGSLPITADMPLAVHIKEEPVDDGYSEAQRGDILDILDHQSTSSVASVSRPESGRSNAGEKVRKRKRKGTAEKLSVEGEGGKKIKEEPVDDYAQFNPFSTNHSGPQSFPNVIQSDLSSNSNAATMTSANPGTGSGNRSDSLSQLSRQVEQIPTLYGQANQIPPFSMPQSFPAYQVNNTRASATGQWMYARPTAPNSIPKQRPLRNVHFARYTLQVTPSTGSSMAFSAPAPRIISAERPITPQMTVLPPRPSSTITTTVISPTPQANTPHAITPQANTPQAIISQDSVSGITSSSVPKISSVNSLTASSSDSNVASVRNVKLHPVYANVSKLQPTCGPLDNTRKKLEDSMTSKTINIDTVGLSLITELIARKNPMPNYKAEPIPSHLLLPGEEFTTHVCYECGDTFNLQSSLKHHHGRYSLQISYKCETCRKMKVFFNKCQFLSHLRGHLNIEKTQAVPIHIKSDSIMIEPLSPAQEKLLFTVPSLSSKTLAERNRKRCPECGKLFDFNSQDSLQRHFDAENSSTSADGRHQCNLCKLYLPTPCALRAHRRIHSCEPPFVCPECGENFSDLSIGDVNGSPLHRFTKHVMFQCMHVGRSMLYECVKCPDAINLALYGLKKHIYETMDQYYKCHLCPMAFKQQDAFMSHFSKVHIQPGKKPERYFKVIFRCHCCDSLIDDRLVFETHVQQHLNVAKRETKFVYKCYVCSQVFDKKATFIPHLSKPLCSPNKAVFNLELLKCLKCNFKTKGADIYLKHIFNTHISETEENPVGFCNICGFFLVSGTAGRQHDCLSQKTGKSNVIMPSKASLCKICGKYFLRLFSHLMSHQREGINFCIYCQRYNFENIRQRIEHELSCPMKGVKTKKVKTTLPGENAGGTMRKIAKENTKSNQEGEGKKKMQLSPVPRYPCPECDRLFIVKDKLVEHMSSEHTNMDASTSTASSLFPCHLCGLMYDTQQSLKKHLKVSHEGKRNAYSCLMCRKKGLKRHFTNRLLLEKHLMAKHKITKSKVDQNIITEDPEQDDSILPPPPVSKATSTPDVKSPERDDSPIKRLHVDGDQLFNCAKCNFACEDRKEFLDHLQEHNISDTVQCQECGLSFAIVLSLKKHLFMVHKIKDFDKYCAEEGLEYKEEELSELIPEEALSSHSDADTKEEEEEEEGDRDPLECRVCYRKFEDEAKLRSHMRNHGMAFIRNRRRERASSSKSSPNKSLNGNESSDSSVSVP